MTKINCSCAEDFDRVGALVGSKVLYFEELASTNDTARAMTDLEEGTIVIAERQSAGRGQRGNSWSSGEGLNLTFTMVLRPDFLGADRQFYVSKIAALAVRNAVVRCGVESQIKWSNDIYVGDRKISGILIENDLLGGRMIRTVIGVGLNVNQCEFDPKLPNPTSIAMESGCKIDRLQVLQFFCEELFAGYEALYREDYELIDASYMKVLYRYDNNPYTFREPNGDPFKATIQGVESTGELILKTAESGDIKSYAFKEIEFIL